jgi:hypothetical protein
MMRRSLLRRQRARTGTACVADMPIMGALLPIKETCMKSIVLWLLGVPVSVIILLKIFGVF